MKKLFPLLILLIICLSTMAQAAETWQSGQSHFYSRRGLTGGGTALDALSGLSMCPNDYAVTLDITGNTIYFHQVSSTGNNSGTTSESSPDWIAPNSSDNGETVSGVSMWKLTGLTGVTGVFKTLVLDGRTVKGATVDEWNKIESQVSTFVRDLVTAHTNASAFTGVTDFAIDSQVSSFVIEKVRNATDLSSFTGVTDFAVDSQVTDFVTIAIRNATTLSSFTGVSDFAVDSQVTDFVRGELRTYLAGSAFTGTTDFAVDSQVTGEITLRTVRSAFTGVTGFAVDSEVSAYVIAAVRNATADSAFTGTTDFAVDSQVSSEFRSRGASLSTTGVSLWAGVSEYIKQSSGATSFIANAVTIYQTSVRGGATPWESGTTIPATSGNIQFVEGNNVTITVASDGVGAKVTIASASGGAGGTGVTNIQGNDGTDGIADAIGIDYPSGMFIHGAQGIWIIGSAGNTIFVQGDNLHSQVSKYVTDHTEKSSFANSTNGVTDFSVNSEVTASFRSRGAPQTTSGASLWGGVSPYIRSAVSDFQSGTTYFSGVSKTVTWTLLYPDWNGISSVTPVKLYTPPVSVYPSGVVIVEMNGEVISGNTTYDMSYFLWRTREASSGTSIGVIRCASGVSKTTTGVTIVPPGGSVFIHPDTSNGAHQIDGYFVFYPR